VTIPVMRPALGDEEAAAAAAAVLSGWVAQGPRVRQFEQLFAARVGADHGVAVSSCTAGLHLAMVLLGIGPGDDVVVPSLSFIATANAVRYVGATPVFADVDVDTLNVSAKTVEEVLTPRTRAVVVVHQAGIPADVDELRDLCDRAEVQVIEDAACAIGSTYKGRPVGAASPLAAWSFHPRKVITTGEGGMVTVTGEADAARLRRLREHGMSVSAADRHEQGGVLLEEYVELGFNYRMTDVQAAIGIVQLARLDALLAERRQLAARYHELLLGLPIVGLAQDPAYGESNYQSFWVHLPYDTGIARNAVLARLAADGIAGRRGIMAAHLEPAYEAIRHGDLAVTEDVTRNTLILPLFPGMTEAEQERVVCSLASALETPR
jgi:perosamine synthetase